MADPEQFQQDNTLEQQKNLAIRRDRQNRRYDQLVKAIAVGNAGVGKTSLLRRHILGVFDSKYMPTVGTDVLSSNSVVIPDGRVVRLQCWDPSGQERFNAVTHQFYRNSQAVLLMYDVTDRQSFHDIEDIWIPTLRYRFEIGNKTLEQAVSMVLIGNKCDYSPQNRQVSVEEGQALAQKLGLQFYETSAKADLNVAEAVGDLVCITIDRIYPTHLWQENQLNALANKGKKQPQPVPPPPKTLAQPVNIDENQEDCSFCKWFASTASGAVSWMFGSNKN